MEPAIWASEKCWDDEKKHELAKYSCTHVASLLGKLSEQETSSPGVTLKTECLSLSRQKHNTENNKRPCDLIICILHVSVLVLSGSPGNKNDIWARNELKNTVDHQRLGVKGRSRNRTYLIALKQ